MDNKLSTLAFIFFLLHFVSCQDEELLTGTAGQGIVTTRSVAETAGLVQNADGNWVTSQRVPLVGEGCIIDDLSSALIQVINTDKSINNLLDTDLNNSASFNGVAGIDAIGNQIASVLDVNRTYAGGQEAGFVYKVSDNSLLTASVLKGFWVATYLDGQQQEMKGGDPDVKTLQLNLISAANNDGKQTISISTRFDKPFNEIKIGIRGVDIKVLQSLSLYYAFVGENEIKPSVPSNFPDVRIHQGVLNWTNGFFQNGAQKLVNEDLSDYVTIELLGSLVQPFVTVDFGKIIPTGSEVGFCTSSLNLLQLGLLKNTKLTTYDENDNEVEDVTVGSVLGLSAVAGGDSYISMVIQKPCSQIKLGLYGANVNLGGTLIRYAFVRDPIRTHISAGYSLSNATVTSSTYHFHKPENGSVSFNITGFPDGAEPSMKGNAITGMSLPGKYVVEAVYTATEEAGGGTFRQTVTITRKETPSITGCNNLITIAEYPGIELGRSSTISGGCLLCLAEGTNNAGYIIDADPDNYASYYNILSLAANTHITGIKTGETINGAGKEIRVGFTFQPNATLLSADALKFFVVKLFRNGTEVLSSEVDNSSVVTAGLIDGEETRLRMSVTTRAAFDAIELWTAGVLNLNLNSFRLYNAFWEPTEGCASIESSADACIEMMTPASYGAYINYNATGVNGVGNVAGEFIGLGKALDDNKDTYATITVTDVVAATTLAVGFQEMPAYQTTGFIIQAPDYVADVNLLDVLTISVYRKGQKLQSSADDLEALGLGLISYRGKKYVEVTPTLPYDEIRISFAAVAELLRSIYVYGAFTRMDSNGNGIPDCAETGGEQSDITAANVNPHNCAGSSVEIYTTGGDTEKTYRLRLYNYAAGNVYQDYTLRLQAGNKFVLEGLQPGDYYISISDEYGLTTYYSGVHATVHPHSTVWKGDAASSDWNDWQNWTAGTPWDCTDVVIPEGCIRYPILKRTEENYCARIHFQPQSEVVNTQYLHYSNAWVDLRMNAGEYYMLSMPLKDTYSGDLFLAAGNPTVTGEFPVLTEANYPQNRFSPSVSEKQWNRNVESVDMYGNEILLFPGAAWTTKFTSVSEKYTMGQGFLFRINQESLATGKNLVFRLPKQHVSYSYYDIDTKLPSSSHAPFATIRTKAGRFIYENDADEAPDKVELNLHNEVSSFFFVVGNPFMAHLDIEALIAGNNINEVRLIRGVTGGAESAIKVESQAVLTSGRIAPAEAFIIKTKSATTAFSLTLDESMMYKGNGFIIE